MAAHVCGCRDANIVEGIFGEIYPELLTKKNTSEKSEDIEESMVIDAGGEGNQNSFADPVPIQIKSYTMTNSNRMEIVLITWGATIVSLKCPDKFGRTEDVVLGFDDLESYIDPTINPFIGCMLGRCANRIREGSFSIKDKDYQLSQNDINKHHLHGGFNGFGRQIWNSYVDGCTVVMSYLSEDGEEGYPGAVLTTIRFKLTPDNKLDINIRATASKSTIVNISHGSHFNLAGHAAGESELKNHKISLNCDRWTFSDYNDPIPTGAIRGVGGTVMDLRIPQLLGEVMEKVSPGEGYDHNFCVIRSWQPGISFVARALHIPSGRILEVYSDQPGLQFYTGGRLINSSSFPSFSHECSEYIKDEGENEEEQEKNTNTFEPYYNESEEIEEMEKIPMKERSKPLKFLPGKNGGHYKNRCAFSIQPQNYPNAVNFKHFPCNMLHPGQVYYHDITYKFGVQLGNYM